MFGAPNKPSADGLTNTPSGLGIPNPGGLNGLIAPGNWSGTPVNIILPNNANPPNNYVLTAPRGVPYFGM